MQPVSVVVTVKNDPRVLTCVDAILAQQAPFPFHVIVVDNGSTDETPRLLNDRFTTNPRVRLLAQGGNLSEAWNHAARSTTSPVLVRLDADAQPLEGWLAALTAPLLERLADWAAGPVSGAEPEDGIVARYFHHRTEAYCRRLAQDRDLRDAVPSWNVAYRREALEAAGWYDPWQASSVDWDLHKRLRRAGARGIFVPEAHVLHHHPTSLREFTRKEAWYRTGHYQMALKYGFGEMFEAFVLPGAYALLILFLLLSILWRPFLWLAMALLMVLFAKHWFEGYREGDPLWPYRVIFRPLEGVAGLYGLLRGLLRYGLRARARA